MTFAKFNFSSSNLSSLDFSFTNFRNSIASSSFSPLAFLTAFKEVFKNIFVFTPGISKGYWKAKNIPLCALSSVSSSNKSFSSKRTSPETSYPFYPDKMLDNVLFPDPLGPKNP